MNPTYTITLKEFEQISRNLLEKYFHADLIDSVHIQDPADDVPTLQVKMYQSPAIQKGINELYDARSVNEPIILALNLLKEHFQIRNNAFRHELVRSGDDWVINLYVHDSELQSESDLLERLKMDGYIDESGVTLKGSKKASELFYSLGATERTLLKKWLLERNVEG